MFRSLISLLLFFGISNTNAQTTYPSGYVMLRDHNLPLSEIKDYDKQTLIETKALLDTIKKTDQGARTQTYEHFIKTALYTDSLNFIKYRSFFEKVGYLSFDKKKFEKQNMYSTDLFLTHYIQQLHFSDRFGLPLINLILRSIPKRTCNEDDLMNYFVTYLWRKTEFIKYGFVGIPYHIILMPDLDRGKYSAYFKFAFEKYMEHCKKYSSGFSYFYLPGIQINKGKINWGNYLEQFDLPATAKKIMKNTISIARVVTELMINVANAFEIPEGSYSILFCSHPYIMGNPLYRH